MTFKSWLTEQVDTYRKNTLEYHERQIVLLENKLDCCPPSYRLHYQNELRKEEKELIALSKSKNKNSYKKETKAERIKSGAPIKLRKEMYMDPNS
jgi:hypothetical protein